MSPAVQDALNQFIIQFLSFAGVIVTVGGLALKAYVDRRIRRKDKADDQALEEREQARQIELEQMRQKTAELQQKVFDAELKTEQAAAITESVGNLASTMLQLIQSQNAGFHANAQAISNQAQSIGDLEQSMDKVAEAVVDSSAVAKAATKAVSELFDRFAKVFPTDRPMDDRFEDLKRAIIDALEKACEEKKNAGDLPPLETVKPAPADELPKASGQ